MLSHFNQLKFFKIKFQNLKKSFHKKNKKKFENFFNIPRGDTHAEYKKNALYALFIFLVFWIFWKFTQFNFQNCSNNSHNLYLYIVWISEHKFLELSDNYFYTFYCIKIPRTFVPIICRLPSRQNNRIT